MLDFVNLINKSRPTTRTQISLLPEIKKAIEARKRLTGESVSAFLRKAALIRLLAEEEEKKELENLSKLLVGSVSSRNHPEWKTKKKIDKWVREIRSEWR